MKDHADSPPHLAGGEPARPADAILHRRYRLTRPWLPADGKSVLDYGCGNGAQTILFAADFPRLIGVDVEREFLWDLQRECRRHGWNDRIGACLCDGARLSIRDAAFDCAVSFEVLEHVRDERASLAELHRVLKPAGILAISVPNRWWIFETHGADLPLLPWNRVPFFSWLPKRWHDRFARARIYRRREIVHLLREAGFTIQHTTYVTAPLDVLKWRPLQRLLRATLFRSDRTRWPFLATAVLVIARR